MSKVTFRSRILLKQVNPYVLVHEEHANKLYDNWRKAMPVKVRVNCCPDDGVTTNLMPAGDGSFYLYLHTQLRRASGSKVGDLVTIELEPDHSYRSGPMHPVPPSFKAKLRSNSMARRNWTALSPSRQKEILRYFASLKSRDAQERNIDRTMAVLTGDRARFMGRTWNE